MTSTLNTSAESLSTVHTSKTRKVLTIIVKSFMYSSVEFKPEQCIVTWDLDATLRENITRHFYDPDCPFWQNFDVSGEISFASKKHA